MSPKVKTIYNVAHLQIGWWSIVLNAEKTHFILIGVFVATALHLLLLSEKKVTELLFLTAASAIGFLFDTLALQVGLISFIHSTTFPPFWLFALWLVFSVSFFHSLSWLEEKPLWSFVLGAIFAPLTYYAGERFNLLSFGSDLQEKIIHLVIYGILWGFLLVALFKVKKLFSYSKK